MRLNVPKLLKTNPELFDAKLAKRGIDASPVIAAYQLYRHADTRYQEALANRNKANVGTDIQAMREKSVRLNEIVDQCDEEYERAKDHLEKLLAEIPNLPDDTVPDGKNENDNVVLYTHGEPPDFDFVPNHHDNLLAGLLDRHAASLMSGGRFSVMYGKLAKLHRAVGQFMIDTHTLENGFEEVNVPILVNDYSAYNTGQLPKFRNDVFETTDGRILIPTAEVSLTNLVAYETLTDLENPRRYVALTPCFRKEAGSAGRDTRGLIRQNQFEKCELVTICRPDQSEIEHRYMLMSAESILKKLGLPYRCVLLCVGDMGFSAQKTYDLEVWFPGQGLYREISSVSNCGEFQALRMGTRYKDNTGKGFVHTLNGSGLAVGRTVAAIVENYQQKDGSIQIPDALLPYMSGIKTI